RIGFRAAAGRLMPAGVRFEPFRIGASFRRKIGGPKAAARGGPHSVKLWLHIAALLVCSGAALAQTPPQAAAGLPDPFGPPQTNWASPEGGGEWGSTAG